ncbi:hypothetical protein MNBD_GAMMA05-1985 [hydrothermal vent metagenome]|uniref:PEP-CTERM protein-sorting domain-containing protein n=1 Tax=hydrothermal vent metagenome TaxID=652676 RepID=A0A3B0WHD1_9ZZZZ
MRTNKKFQLLAVAGLLVSGMSTTQAATVLLSETFDNADGPFPWVSCGYNCSHRVDVGVAVTTAAASDPGASADDIATGADNDWYAGVFEQDDNGYVATDVGIQYTGGGSNQTPVGLVKDDSGLLISFDASGMNNITLSFDWRTFVAGSLDKFVVGYFVGDLTAGKTNGFNSYREINLSATGNPSSAVGGAEDGDWNWNPINGGNTGNWNELLRGNRTDTWGTETFNLDLAADESEVWLAFWLDNGNDDIGKFDNVLVTGDVIPAVPVPAAVWLFGSGLLGLIGVARRKA